MTRVRPVSHVGLSDESHWNIDRFRSLGLVTTSVGCLDGLEVELRALLDESGVPEFEWKKLGGAKERFAAQKMCSFAVEKGCAGLLRVDVLVWDIEDSRHKIAARDDVSNLHRMYYHLFRNVLRERWPDDAVWRLHPDRHSAMDWATVHDCLECVAMGFEAQRSLLNQGKAHVSLRREFGLEEISPASSGEHPLLQLADLFAGLAVFSREKFQEYGAWLSTADGQSRLIEDVDPPSTSSRRSQERFRVLRCFDRLCKGRRLGVSLQSYQGLYTFNPDNPLNFWLYQSQHPFDVAPRKAQR